MDEDPLNMLQVYVPQMGKDFSFRPGGVKSLWNCSFFILTYWFWSNLDPMNKKTHALYIWGTKFSKRKNGNFFYVPQMGNFDWVGMSCVIGVGTCCFFWLILEYNDMLLMYITPGLVDKVSLYSENGVFWVVQNLFKIEQK